MEPTALAHHRNVVIGDRVRLTEETGSDRRLFVGASGPVEEIYKTGGNVEMFVRIGQDLVPFYRHELALVNQ